MGTNATSFSCLSPQCRVEKSPIHGSGLFAKNDISRDDIVAVKGGYIFDSKQWAEKERLLGSAEIQIAKDLFIAPSCMEEREESTLYSNHSCDPNIGIQGQIVFVAMRDISMGEELTHDWATTDNGA